MKTTTCLHSTQVHIPTTSEEWQSLSKTLLAYIKNNLHTLSVVHWLGSETELADDVLQETYACALQFVSMNTTSEGTSSIKNFEAFCKIIAKRYILDLRRKDKRLIGSIDDDNFSIAYVLTPIGDDPAEVAIEHIDLYSSMLTFSQIVKRFPKKLQIALLIDLARRADFDREEPQPLEQAMWTVGISLIDYYHLLPSDPMLRSRHNALVCLAYQRLRLVYYSMFSQPTM